MKINKAVERLLRSYQEDKEPFVVNPSLKFSSRKYPFEEINLIKQVLFPKQWNCGKLTKNKNCKELNKKIDALGKLFAEGVSPYVKDKEEVEKIVVKVLENLGEIRDELKKD